MSRKLIGLRCRRTASAVALALAFGVQAGSLPETAVGPSSSAKPTSLGEFSGVEIGLVPVMTGLVDPIFLTNAGDGSQRLFVVEQRGIIKIRKHGLVLATPFLDIRSMVESGGERGLLGLAFHPKHETNRKLYVLFTIRGTGDLIIAELRAGEKNPDRVLLLSFRRLLRIKHRAHANHNGGMLAFGRDGYLYIATGDGGGAGDTANHAQSRKSRLGKILRIDVDGGSGSLAYRIPPTNPHAVSTTYKREIWSRGLRNPFRFSFDRLTGDLWIGDVGQNRFEEVNRALRTKGGGRAINFGWRVTEGYECFQPPAGCDQKGKQAPLAVYDHSEGCAIIGGYVYRGPIKILRGAYLFSDFCSGRIWSVVAGGASRQSKVLMADTGLPISSFGESERGRVYVTALDGNVYRLSASALIASKGMEAPPLILARDRVLRQVRAIDKLFKRDQEVIRSSASRDHEPRERQDRLSF